MRPCGRWCVRWLRALAAGVLALLTLSVPAARGDEEASAVPEEPVLAAAPPTQTVVIINQHGDVTIAGDAEGHVRACGLTPGCIAYWEEGVGPIIVVGADDIAGGAAAGGTIDSEQTSR